MGNAYYCKMMFENVGGWGSVESVRLCLDGSSNCGNLQRSGGATWTGCPTARHDQSPSPSRRRTLLRATLRILIASVVALLGLGTRATSASASQISVRFKVMSYSTHYSGYPSEITQLEAKINKVGPTVGSSDHSAIALELAV